MFHPSRLHNRPALRSTPLPAVLFVLALVAGLSAQSQNPQLRDVKSAKPAEAKTFSATPASAALRLNLRAAVAAASAGGTTVATPQSGTADYFMIRAEFDSTASRERLAVPGFTVLTAFDRFVDLF